MADAKARSGVVCAGAWCIDRNITVDHWPAEETVARMLSETPQGGCPGHNMATALKKLGAVFPIEAIGLIGDDANGRMLTEICDQHGIDRAQLEVRPGVRTSETLAMIAKGTGKRSFFYGAGAHAIQTPDGFDFKRTQGRFVHLGLPGLHNILDAPWKGDASGWVTILKAAQAEGLKTNVELVSIAPEKIRAHAEPMLPYLDMFIVNDLEVGAVAGLDTVLNGETDVAACRMAAARVLERSKIELVAIHFPKGGMVLTRDGRVFERPSVRVPQKAIKSSNGAGDAFAAGILYGVHEGWPLDRALDLAHASAASSLRADSTTGSIVPWEECLRLASGWGWREALG